MAALDQFDFAIMVLSPDDLLESRNDRSHRLATMSSSNWVSYGRLGAAARS